MMTSKVRIIVTGGSGFIGSHLVDYLLSNDFEVINIDRNAPENPNHFKCWKKIDILDCDKVSQFMSEFDPEYILHFAARTDLAGRSHKDYSANTEGTQNIVNASVNAPALKKVVFASSMLVCKAGYIPKSDTDYFPINAYGESKVIMEKIIRSGSYPWQWSIVRPTSIWGPGFKEPYRNFFDTVKRGVFLDIGKHYCSKTYGYIGNAIYQIIRILFDNSTNKRTFYLGDAPPIFISKWGQEIADEYGVRRPRRVPFSVIRLAAIAGDLFSKVGVRFGMNSYRLKNMTTDNIYDLSETYKVAPNPPYSHLDGIRNTIEWLKKQESK